MAFVCTKDMTLSAFCFWRNFYRGGEEIAFAYQSLNMRMSLGIKCTEIFFILNLIFNLFII